MQECLDKKYTRKDIISEDIIVSGKGVKLSKKVSMEGFADELSQHWIGMLVSIPKVSENKAIAIAKVYPTFRSLMQEFTRTDISDSDKRKLLSNIDENDGVDSTRSKKIGKKVAERIYEVMSSVDPDMPVDKPEESTS